MLNSSPRMAAEASRKLRQSLSQVNPHLICGLCQGYLINATAITECLHTFCRPCIVQFFTEKKTCPLCGVLVHKTKPHVNLRPDKVLQDLVYKLVPGLYKREMKRRKDYYAAKTKTETHSDVEASQKVVDPDGGGASLIYTEDDQISLCMHHCERLPPFVRWGTTSRRQRPMRHEVDGDKRYLLCQAGMSIGHLKKFLRLKFDLEPKFEIELFQSDESLEDGYRLMDVAYICDWRMVAPLELYYIVYDVTQKPIALPEVIKEKPIVSKKEKVQRPKVKSVGRPVKRKKRKPRQALMTRRKSSKTRLMAAAKLPAETISKVDDVKEDSNAVVSKLEDTARDSGIPESPEQGAVVPGSDTPDRPLGASAAPIVCHPPGEDRDTEVAVTVDKNQNNTETIPAMDKDKDTVKNVTDVESPSLDLETFLESKQTALTVETELPVKDTGRNHSADSGFISQGAIDDSSSSDQSSSEQTDSEQSTSEQSSSEQSTSEQSTSEQSTSEQSSQDDSPDRGIKEIEKAPIEKIVIVCDSGKFRHADKNERRKSESGSIGSSVSLVEKPKIGVKTSKPTASSIKPVEDNTASRGLLLSTVKKTQDNKRKKPEGKPVPEKRQRTEATQAKTDRKDVAADSASGKQSNVQSKANVKSAGKKASGNITGAPVSSASAASTKGTKDAAAAHQNKSERTPLFERFSEDLTRFQAAKDNSATTNHGNEGDSAVQAAINKSAAHDADIADCNKLQRKVEVMMVDEKARQDGHCRESGGDAVKENTDQTRAEQKQSAAKTTDCELADKRPAEASQAEDQSQQLQHASAGDRLLSVGSCSPQVNMSGADSSACDLTAPIAAAASALVVPVTLNAAAAGAGAGAGAVAGAGASADSHLCTCPSPSTTTSSVSSSLSDSSKKRQSTSQAVSSPRPDRLILGKPLCTSTPAADTRTVKRTCNPITKKPSQANPLRNGAKTNGASLPSFLPKDYSNKLKPSSSSSLKKSDCPPSIKRKPTSPSSASKLQQPTILKQNTNTQLLKPRESKSKSRPRPRSVGHSQPPPSSPAPSPIPYEPPTKRSRVLHNGYPTGAYQQGLVYQGSHYFHGAHHLGLPPTIYGTGAPVQVSHPGLSPMGPISPGPHHGYFNSVFNHPTGYPPFFNSAPSPASSMPNGYDAPLELTTTRKDAPREAHKKDTDKAKEPERTLLRVPSLVRP